MQLEAIIFKKIVICMQKSDAHIQNQLSMYPILKWDLSFQITKKVRENDF